RANDRAVACVADEINRIVAGGSILNVKADTAHGSDSATVAGGCLRSAPERADVFGALIIYPPGSPSLRHMAAPGVVRADEGQVGGLAGFQPHGNVVGDRI